MKTSTQIIVLAVSITIGFSATASAAGFFENLSKAFSQQDTAKEERDKKQATLPRCAKPLGTITIAPPENQWWRGFNLQSPESLLKLFVQRSGCFTIVDRGRGYEAALRERALSEGGELQVGSEIGKQRITAAKYILIPDLVTNNQNAGGSGLGAILGIFGGLIHPGIGAIAGSIRTIDRSATVTLAITDTVTLEQLPMAEGFAEKTDSGFAFGAAGLSSGAFGAAGAGSYSNTEAGQVIANAYLDAYQKLVLQMGGIAPGAKFATDTPVVEKQSLEAQELQQEETVQ
jgi:hypothetical protein